MKNISRKAMKIKALFFMNFVMSINDSCSLYALSLESIKIDIDTLRIMERIYPYIFVTDFRLKEPVLTIFCSLKCHLRSMLIF